MLDSHWLGTVTFVPPVAAIFTAGWAGGINPYLVVLVLGLAGRLGAEVPEGLLRTDVLVIAGTLALVEFVVDKVMLLDSLWDVVSTVLRPAAAAVVTALWADASSDIVTVALASAGGTVALVSHLSKASVRAAINASPEPATNIAVSVLEDILVCMVVVVALVWPWLAAGIALLLLALGVFLAAIGFRVTRRGVQVVREKFTRRS